MPECPTSTADRPPRCRLAGNVRPDPFVSQTWNPSACCWRARPSSWAWWRPVSRRRRRALRSRSGCRRGRNTATRSAPPARAYTRRKVAIADVEQPVVHRLAPQVWRNDSGVITRQQRRVSAPAHRHAEADQQQTEADDEVPVPERLHRVRAGADIEDDDPQQPEQQEGDEDGNPPRRVRARGFAARSGGGEDFFCGRPLDSGTCGSLAVTLVRNRSCLISRVTWTAAAPALRRTLVRKRSCFGSRATRTGPRGLT